jgi:short-subunit dehydrogenase
MNIIITGASRGIGRETALIFAKNTKNKVIVISRNKSKLQELQKVCFEKNPDSKVIPIPFDLETIHTNGEKLKKTIVSHMNHIDILINNAGFLINVPFEKTTREDAEKILNINFLGPAQLIKLLLPVMGLPGSSHVINISSMGAFQGSVKYSGISYYSASKSAIANLTECLAVEFSEKLISFNCLALGAVQTEMLQEAFPGYIAPLSTHHMAEFVVDFAINGNKYFNGKILPVSTTTP